MPEVGGLIRIAANPDLGPGRIVGFNDAGRLEIQLLWKPNKIAVDGSGVERYILFAGTPVIVRGEEKSGQEPRGGIVIGFENKQNDGLWNYQIVSAGRGTKKKT